MKWIIKNSIHYHLSIRIAKDDKTSYYLHKVEIKKNNNEVSFIDKYDDVKLLLDIIPKRSVLLINIGGKGIIQKLLDEQKKVPTENIKAAFPNINIESFYYQYDPGSGSLAIIRRDLYGKLLKELSEGDLFIVRTSLGSTSLFSYLKAHNKKVLFHTPYHNISPDLNEMVPVDQTQADRINKIDLTELDSDKSLAYVETIGFVENSNYDIYYLPRKQILKEYANFNLIKTILAGTAIVLLFILLLNFFFFLKYTDEQEYLEKRIYNSKEIAADLEAKNRLISKKRDLLLTTSLFNPSFHSYLYDRILSRSAGDIHISSFVINPFEKGKRNKEFKITENKIVIKGTIKNISLLEEWISGIKHYKWVVNTFLVSVVYNENIDRFNFHLEINHRIKDFERKITTDE